MKPSEEREEERSGGGDPRGPQGWLEPWESSSMTVPLPRPRPWAQDTTSALVPSQTGVRRAADARPDGSADGRHRDMHWSQW